jgi:thioester reductase-like protein
LKIKEVFFSSSYTTANRLTDDGFIVEDFPEDDNYGKELKMGYVLTKFVCEKLLKQANARGIPCTVIRYPTLGGHSETGLFSPGSSTFINLLLLSVHLGVISDSETSWYSISVDIAARLTLQLALSDKAVSGLYHINLADPITTTDFIDVTSRYGYPLKRVCDDEYKKVFLEESERNALLSYFVESYGTDLISVISDVNPVLTQALHSRNNVYSVSDKLSTAIPDLQQSVRSSKLMFSKYLEYAKRAGILTKT